MTRAAATPIDLARVVLRVLPLFCLPLLGGCQAFGDYMRFRALDAVDCAKLNVGVGVGIAVDARITDWFAPGLGYMSLTTNYGWDSRDLYGTWDECIVINTPTAVVRAVVGSQSERASPDYDPQMRVGRLALSSVFLANERWIRNPRTREVTVDYYSLFNFSPLASLMRETDPETFFVEPGETPVRRRKRIWDQGWIELGVTAAFLHARAGVNPFQIFDFAAGIFGLDPAGDDRRLFLRGMPAERPETP